MSDKLCTAITAMRDGRAVVCELAEGHAGRHEASGVDFACEWFDTAPERNINDEQRTGDEPV